MDFKAISWAGNVYEKFEAMCLEVEEVIYEDTVKYMENQVQKVGKSVKKFYSEVMQDFVPPSCIDPARIAAADLSPNPYAHADISKKPKLCLVERKKKDTANEDSCDLTSEERNSQLLLSPRVFVENTGAGLCSAKSMKVGIYKRPIGIKRISRTNHSPRTSGPTTCSSRDRSNLVVHDTRMGCTVASDDMNVARISESSVECDPEEAKPESISVSDALEETFDSDILLAAESQRQEKDNSELNPPANKILPVEPSRLDEDNSECTLSYHDKFTKDGSISEAHLRNVTSDACSVESAGKEVIVSHEEYFEIIEEEVSESAEVADYEPDEKSKLDNSCVFVENDMHHLVPQGSWKNKSYKKKLREALSAKLRPMRKQKHSISPYKDSDVENKADLTVNSSSKHSPAQDSLGSGWELI